MIELRWLEKIGSTKTATVLQYRTIEKQGLPSTVLSEWQDVPVVIKHYFCSYCQSANHDTEQCSIRINDA